LHILALAFDQLSAPAVALAIVIVMALYPLLEVLESDSLILLSVLLQVVIVIVIVTVTVTEFVAVSPPPPNSYARSVLLDSIRKKISLRMRPNNGRTSPQLSYTWTGSRH
jgi:hypothetical protein